MNKLKTFESFNQSVEIDYDYILDKIKDHGWGDLDDYRIQKFEKSKYYSGTSDRDAYTEELHKYMYAISIGETK